MKEDVEDIEEEKEEEGIEEEEEKRGHKGRIKIRRYRATGRGRRGKIRLIMLKIQSGDSQENILM